MVLSKIPPNWSTQLINYCILQLMLVLACFNYADCNTTSTPTPPTIPSTISPTIFENHTLSIQMSSITEMTNTAANFTKPLIPGKGKTSSPLANATSTRTVKDMPHPKNFTFTTRIPEDLNPKQVPEYYRNEFPNRIVSPFIKPSKGKQTATIIWMHCIGDDSSGWSGVIHDLAPPHAKVICPVANKISFNMNMGYGMVAWFNMESFKINSTEDPVGTEISSKYIHSLIEHEINGNHIQSNRILLGGFGQGAALALYSAFTCPHTLAGVVSLSGWLPLRKNITKYAHDANRNISVLQCQGDYDRVLADEFPQKSLEFMQLVSSNVKFKLYRDLLHTTNEKELDDMKKFFDKRLPPVPYKKFNLLKFLTGKGAYHY